MDTTTQVVSSTCSADAFDRAMKLLGDFWILHIVDAIRCEELRFCELERALPTISPATLTTRLKKLEEAEIVVRLEETRDKQSVSYVLSPRGHGILPVLDAIKEFTEQHLA